jgi:ABC-type branched-subunit amino acid transport system substrate-binding protein
VIISQVVPFPWDETVPAVAAYHLALKALDPAAEAGFVSLEGYLAGRLAIEALKAAGPEVDRADYLAALQGLRAVDLGGVKMQFGPGDNQGMDEVFLTRITADGGFEPLGG